MDWRVVRLIVFILAVDLLHCVHLEYAIVKLSCSLMQEDLCWTYHFLALLCYIIGDSPLLEPNFQHVCSAFPLPPAILPDKTAQHSPVAAIL